MTKFCPEIELAAIEPTIDPIIIPPPTPNNPAIKPDTRPVNKKIDTIEVK